MDSPGDTSADRLLAWPGVRRTPTPLLELFQAGGFLNEELCARLIELIDANRRPSTVADPNGDDYFRTSETCDLDAADPAVQELEYLLHAFNGIDPAYGEAVQGQRYAVDQEFKAHTDYFEPGGADFERYCAGPGQRTWTAMIFLNEPGAGGGTRFKQIGKTFQPETGKLLTWNNRLPGGEVNPATIHHGMKVRKGVKYVITKWYRERPWR
ncbi:MAG: 2OG-Fe(II) oxygenase [Novosphingobium sp.]|nr:2OG-Fe(II) oxygenase [Novosphingobium sp.]